MIPLGQGASVARAVAAAVLLLAGVGSRRGLQQEWWHPARGDGQPGRYVGAETDVLATYNFARHFQGYVGYNHFFTGEFINTTGPHKDSDFLYAALQYTF